MLKAYCNQKVFSPNRCLNMYLESLTTTSTLNLKEKELRELAADLLDPSHTKISVNRLISEKELEATKGNGLIKDPIDINKLFVDYEIMSKSSISFLKSKSMTQLNVKKTKHEKEESINSDSNCDKNFLSIEAHSIPRNTQNRVVFNGDTAGFESKSKFNTYKIESSLSPNAIGAKDRFVQRCKNSKRSSSLLRGRKDQAEIAQTIKNNFQTSEKFKPKRIAKGRNKGKSLLKNSLTQKNNKAFQEQFAISK